MSYRLGFATAAAFLALAGCANAGSYPSSQPGGPHYAWNQYYDDNDGSRYFRPERNVTCDQERHVCYDQYGLSYTATKEHLGERYANHAVKIYGNQILYFSPKRGVVCDRRAETCSDSDGVDRRWTRQVFNDQSYQPYQDQYSTHGAGGVNRHWSGENGACPPKWCSDK